MKRAWKPRHPPEVMFIGESEHSGDPRRESSLRDPRSESKIPEGNRACEIREANRRSPKGIPYR